MPTTASGLTPSGHRQMDQMPGADEQDPPGDEQTAGGDPTTPAAPMPQAQAFRGGPSATGSWPSYAPQLPQQSAAYPVGPYQPGGFLSNGPAPQLVPTPPSSLTIITVIAWRLVIAGCAAFGLYQAMTRAGKSSWNWNNLLFFSQLSTLLVGITAVGGVLAPLFYRGHYEGRYGMWRGATTSYAMVTMLIFAFVMQGDFHDQASLFEHLVVPGLALIDWLFVGRNQTRVRWWMPLLWLLAFCAAYLPVYIANAHSKGRSMYGFLTVGSPDFMTILALLIAGFLVLFYAIWSLGQIKRAIPQKMQVAPD